MPCRTTSFKFGPARSINARSTTLRPMIAASAPARSSRLALTIPSAWACRRASASGWRFTSVHTVGLSILEAFSVMMFLTEVRQSPASLDREMLELRQIFAVLGEHLVDHRLDLGQRQYRRSERIV